MEKKKNHAKEYFMMLFYGIVACAVIFFVEYTIVNDPRRIIFKSPKIFVRPGETVTVSYRTTLRANTKEDISFVSSNPDVAEVKENGVIEGHKEGSTKITLTITDGKHTRKQSTTVYTTKNTISVEDVSLSKQNIILNEGDIYWLEANLYPSNATNKAVHFISSNPEIALVSASGQVLARKEGRTDITVMTEDGKYKETCKVIVTKKDIKVDQISFATKEDALTVGEEKILRHSIYPSNASNPSVFYQSSDASIASIDGYGNVVAHRAGIVQITATTSSQLKQDTMTLTVKEKEPEKEEAVPTKVIIEEKEIEINSGEEKEIHASVLPLTAVDKRLVWRSMDPSIVSIDEMGIITAHKEGETKIVATASNGVNDSVKVKVTEVKIPVLELTSLLDVIEVSSGETIHVPLVVKPVEASPLSYTRKSSNPKIVGVTHDGFVALSEGEATVTMREKGGQNVSVLVKVVEKGVPATEKITLAPLYKVQKGDSLLLDTKCTPLCSDLTYQIEDNKIASIGKGGLITAHKKGTTKIRVLARSGEMAESTLLVEEPKINIEKVTVEKNNYILTMGEKDVIKAGIVPIEMKVPLSFTSQNEEIVKVDEKGNLEAVAPGQTFVTVQSPAGKYAIVTVKVQEKNEMITSISLSEREYHLGTGDTKDLKVLSVPKTATEKSLIFSSSDQSVATVSSLGRVTAHKKGVATITVSSLQGKKTSAKVTVTEQKISVTGVAFLEDTLYMSIGTKEKVKYQIAPLLATDTAVTYRSFDEKIARISADGVIEGVHSGETYIEVKTVDGGKTSLQKIVVLKENVPATGIRLDTSFVTLTVSSQKRIGASVLPKESTMHTLHYAVSDPSILSVDETGLMKALKPGTSEVVVKGENGIEAKMTVLVKEEGTKAYRIGDSLLLEASGEFGLFYQESSASSVTDLIRKLDENRRPLSLLVLGQNKNSYTLLETLNKKGFVTSLTRLYTYGKDPSFANISTTDLSHSKVKFALGDYQIESVSDGSSLLTNFHITRGTAQMDIVIDGRLFVSTRNEKSTTTDFLMWNDSDFMPPDSLLTEWKPKHVIFSSKLSLEKEGRGPLYLLRKMGASVYDSRDISLIVLPSMIEGDGILSTSKPADGFYKWNGDTYYFVDGLPLTGFQKLPYGEEMKWFYLGDNGKLVVNTCKVIDNRNLCFDKTGFLKA